MRYCDVILFFVLIRKKILFNIFKNSFYLVLKFDTLVFYFGLADPNKIIKQKKRYFYFNIYLILYSSQQIIIIQ